VPFFTVRWSRLPLLAKLLLVNGALLTAAVGAAGWFSYRISSAALRSEMVASGRGLVESFASTNALELLDGETGPLNLKHRLGRLLSAEGRLVGAVVADRDDRVIAASGGSSPVAVIAPVTYDGIKLGRVEAWLDPTLLEHAGRHILLRTAAAVLVAIALNVLLVWLLLRQVLRPVVALGAAAEEVIRGDLATRISLPESDDEIGRAARSFNRMCDALHLHMRFSNAALIERIKSGGLDEPREHQLSVLFGDAAGYTRWSRHHTPAHTHATLNRYYTFFGKIFVSRYHGVIDKFMGDGVMAHFGLGGPPAEISDHARAAVRACIAVQLALRVLSRAIRDIEHEEPLPYRLAVASGRCLVGAIGAKDVMLDYSLIGNVVNLASRMEAGAPRGGLVIDQLTRANLGDLVETVDRGEQRFKGVDTPVRVFAVRGFTDPNETAVVQRYLQEELFDDRMLESVVLAGEIGESKRRRVRDIIRREIEVAPSLPV
jgi:class 3 adenylate cyclase/HAMP domain-containing protein